MEPRNRIPSGLKRLLAVCLSCLVALLAGELVFRLAAGVSSADVAQRAVDLAPQPAAPLETQTPPRVPHPYFGWIEMPGTTLASRFAPERVRIQFHPDGHPECLERPINSAGFVGGSDAPYAKQPGDFVVLVVGGSVARWFALQGGERLLERLRALPQLRARNVKLVNGASGAFKQPQQVTVAATLNALGLEPDAVVNIDGFNELALAGGNLQAGIHPAFPYDRRWAEMLQGAQLSASLRHAIHLHERAAAERDVARQRAADWAPWSAAVGHLFVQRATAWEAERQRRAADYATALAAEAKAHGGLALRGPLFTGRDPSRVVGIWERGSLALKGLCMGWNAHYLHVLQPTAHDTTPTASKPLTAEERARIASRDDPWAVAVREGYPRLRARVAALRAHDVAFLDLSRLYEDEAATIYIDDCHYNQRGNDALADHIARALAQLTER